LIASTSLFGSKRGKSIRPFPVWEDNETGWLSDLVALAIS